MYEHDMAGEGGSVLIEPGWNEHRVVEIEHAVSKSGNEMFVVTLEEPQTGSIDTVYMVAVQGKRWLLKQFLGACGILPSSDGKHKWTEDDVRGCTVEAYNKHEPNEFIRKDGTTVKEMRNKINGFRTAKGKATV